MRRRSTSSEIPIQRRVHLFERLYADLKANEPYGKNTRLEIKFTFGSPSDGLRVETNAHRQELRSYLTGFRQLISDDDPVFLPRILRALPRHVDDADLRDRLGRAYDAWKAAQGVPSVIARAVLGPFASGRMTARLYMNGGIFHSDPDLSDVWDGLGGDRQRVIEHQFRQYEGKVRLVFIELKKVIDEARSRGLLRDEPLDLSEPSRTAGTGSEPAGPTGGGTA